MAEMGFSVNAGRVHVSFPDEMSFADLRAAMDAHLSIAVSAEKAGFPHNPPHSGRKKQSIEDCLEEPPDDA
ncbi:MAG: hypothetical protein AAFQ36_09360 [Pseudomonadota bacterium]